MIGGEDVIDVILMVPDVFGFRLYVGRVAYGRVRVRESNECYVGECEMFTPGCKVPVDLKLYSAVQDCEQLIRRQRQPQF